jgi:hypothetical protein
MPRTTFSLRTTTPELIKQINPENQKLIEKFLREREREQVIKLLWYINVI